MIRTSRITPPVVFGIGNGTRCGISECIACIIYNVIVIDCSKLPDDVFQMKMYLEEFIVPD